MTEMNGNVFQLATERKKKDQFDDTLEALKIYASTKFADDIAHLDPLFRKLKRPTIAKPDKPAPTEIKNEDGTITVVPVDTMDADIYKERMKKYDKKLERFDGTLRALYNVVWGQTSDLLRNQLQEHAKFEAIEDDADVTSLLKEIKKACHEIENKVNLYDSIDEVQRQFFAYRQQPEESNAAHLKRFKNYVEVLDHYGVTMFEDDLLVQHEREKDIKAGIVRTSDMVKKEVRNKKLATCFIRRANVKSCGPILDMLRDAYLMNQDLYPKNLEEAYALLQNHSSSKKKKHPSKTPNNENRGAQERERSRGNNNDNSTITGQSYYQKPPDEQAVTGADGTINSKVKCYKCKKWGHYATNCPSSGTGEQHFQQNNDDDDPNQHLPTTRPTMNQKYRFST